MVLLQDAAPRRCAPTLAGRIAPTGPPRSGAPHGQRAGARESWDLAVQPLIVALQNRDNGLQQDRVPYSVIDVSPYRILWMSVPSIKSYIHETVFRLLGAAGHARPTSYRGEAAPAVPPRTSVRSAGSREPLRQWAH